MQNLHKWLVAAHKECEIIKYLIDFPATPRGKYKSWETSRIQNMSLVAKKKRKEDEKEEKKEE
jgi:hypothetical protein